MFQVRVLLQLLQLVQLHPQSRQAGRLGPAQPVAVGDHRRVHLSGFH